MKHLKRVLVVAAASLMIAACGNDVSSSEAADETEVSLAPTTTRATTTAPSTTSSTTSTSSTSTSSTTTTAPGPENGEVLFTNSETGSDYCSVTGGYLRLETEDGYDFYSGDGNLVESFSEDELVVVTNAGEFVKLESSADVALGAGINPDDSDFFLTATDGDGKELWSVDARYDAPIDGNAQRQIHFVPGGLTDELIVGVFTTAESSGSGYPGVVSLKDGSLLWFDPDGSFDGVSPGVVLVDDVLRDLTTGDELPLSGLYEAYEQIDDFVIPVGSYPGNRVLSASSGAVLFEPEFGENGDADGVSKNVVFLVSGDDGAFVQAFALKDGAEAWSIPAETVDYSGFDVQSVGWGLVMGQTNNDFAVIDAATGKQTETYGAESITWINDETNVDRKLSGSSSDLGWVGRDNHFTGSRHLLCTPTPQIIATDTPVIGVNEDTGENLLSPLGKKPES